MFIFMLDQSLWKCLFFWLVKFHFFLGPVVMGFAVVSVWGGQCFCARGLKHKNTDHLIDPGLHWVSYSAWINENCRHWSFLLFTMMDSCTGSNESGLKNSTAKNKQKNIKNKTERKQQKKEKKWHTKKRKQEKLHCSSDRIRYTDDTWEASVLKELVLNHNWNHSWPTTSSLPWMSFQSQASMTREHPWEME